MLKDVEMSAKNHRNMIDAVYAGKSNDDGIRNKEQHEGKGRELACNNRNIPYILYFYRQPITGSKI